MNSIALAKEKLRAEALARRREISAAARKSASARIAANFTARFQPRPGSVVAGYWPLPDEADIRALMSALADGGCEIALPVVLGPGEPLEFRKYVAGDDLRDAAFGTKVPAPGQPVLRPDIVIVPMLAFDAQGYRLGFGKGYYDRTLARLRAPGAGVAAPLAVGVAFDSGRLDAVPHDRFDQRLDWIVTECEVLAIDPH